MIVKQFGEIILKLLKSVEDNKIEIKYLVDKINSLKFDKLESISVGDALYCPILWSSDNRFLSVFKNVLKIIFSIFVKEYRAIYNGDPNTVYLFNKEYKRRNDFKKNYEELVFSTNNYLYVKPDFYKFSFDGMYYISTYVNWFKLLCNLSINFKKKIFLLYMLIQAYSTFVDIKFVLNDKRIVNLVTLCDYHCGDSLLTQILKNNYNYSCVTLQHGFYNFDFTKDPFIYSHSNYFLCYGNYEKESVKSIGLDDKKYIPVGMLSNLEFDINSLRVKENCICLFLGGENLYHEFNLKVINFSMKLCETYDIDLLIKSHPTSSFDYNYLSNDRISIINKNEPLMNFLGEFCLGIVINSTVFLDLISKNIPVLLAKDKNYIQIFSENEISFCSYAELELLYKELMLNFNNSVFDKIRQKYICQGNTKDNYLNALKSINIKI